MRVLFVPAPSVKQFASMTRTLTCNIKLAALWPKLFKLCCCYCSGGIGNGKLAIEGEAAHASCHREACS